MSQDKLTRATRPGLLLAGIAVVYFATAWASIEFTRHTTEIAAIWPANAVLCVALLRTRRAAWPAVLAAGYVANVAANIVTRDDLLMTWMLSACNTVEILLCALPCRARLRAAPDLARSTDMALFGTMAVIAAAVSATLATALMATRPHPALGDIWRTWFLADALGLLIFGPMLLAIRPEELSSRLRPGIVLRGGAMLLLVATVAVGVFLQSSYPLLFLVFPALVLAAFSLGCTGAALATFLVAAVATILTGAGSGPLMLVDGGAPERVLLLQGFLATAVLVAVPVATALAERDRLAQTVTDTQGRLDDALASMADGLALFDARQRLVLCNQRYRDLFPLSADLREPGVALADLVREAARRGEYAGLDVGNVDAWLAARGEACNAEQSEEVALADGRFIDVVSRPTRGGDRIFVYRDVTERKRLEADLEARNRRLEAMNAELDQFASMAAHDLRAPLRQVSILCEWLDEELAGVSSEAVRDHARKIGRRVRRMGGLVEGLRQYAYAGGKNLPATEVALGPLAADAVELASPPTGFVIEVDRGMPTIMAPEAALSLVLRNLVGNAVKHHDRHDGRVRVRAVDGPAGVEIVVEDDGPGIPEDHRERVFDLFARFRGDAAEPGGVGLALVRRTATVHGGRAWITPSEIGKGTAVHVFWPRQLSLAA